MDISNIPIHLGDYDLISNVKAGQSFVDSYVSGAIAYWQNPPSGMVECVIGGAVPIKRLVS